MLNLYEGTPANNPEDIKYINRLLQQLVYTHYNLHKRDVHLDYQTDECSVLEDWTVIASRNLIKNTVREDMGIASFVIDDTESLVKIDKLPEDTLHISIVLNPEDEIEYTITPVSKRQLDEMLKGLYQPDTTDTEKYEEVIR